MKKNIADMRQKYGEVDLSPENVSPNPFQQFQDWFSVATESGILEPNAMTLASSTSDGKPSARIVLLKGIDEKGFLFYTNYESRKGEELIENPQAALIFYWDTLHRQVRIEGKVEKASQKTSDAYFNKRPKGSQIGAWASPQSQVIDSRSILENNKASLNKKYANQEQVPRPKHWGGFRVKPQRIEFWQGRNNRLHDRVVYEKMRNGRWKIFRLAP